MHEASGIYEPMLTHGWIGPRPDDYRLALKVGNPVPKAWCNEIVNEDLNFGVRVTAQRRGFVVYDFADWQPGVANSKRGIRTLSEASADSAPALIHRLRVLNAHQILFHAATLFTTGETLPATRIASRDLYKWDLYDGEEEYWYSSAGALLDTIVPADRLRTDSVPIAAFKLSLEWLDLAARADSLIEFDLLSQAHVAVSTHDRASAVVAAWTICELSLNHLNNDLPQPLPPTGRHTTPNAKRLIDHLERAGRLDPDVKRRLKAACDERDTWLHAGHEPTGDAALEALDLAIVMLRLRQIVADLAARPTSQLVIL